MTRSLEGPEGADASSASSAAGPATGTPLETSTRQATSSSGTLASISSYAAVTALAALLSALAAILLGRLLGPERYGIYTACLLIVVWGRHSHLGLFNAFGKQFPVERGASNHQRATQIANSTFWTSLGMTLPVIVSVLLVAALSDGLTWPYRLGMTAMALQLLPQQVLLYFIMHDRCVGSFGRVNRVVALQVVSDVALKLTATWFFGLRGLFAASALSILIPITYAQFASPARFSMRIDAAVVSAMFRLGAPIFAVGMLTVAFDSAGRTLVLVLHPAEVLGYFGMAQMFAGMMRLIPQATQFVLGPKMMGAWGASSEISALAANTVEPTRFLCLIMLTVMVFGTVAFELIVNWFLPAFRPAIPIGRILFAVVYFRGMASLYQVFLVTLDRRKAMFIWQGLALVLTIALVLLEIPLGAPGVDVAAALLLGAAVYGLWIVTHCGVRHLGWSTGTTLRQLAALTLPLAVVLAIAHLPILKNQMDGISWRSDLAAASLALVLTGAPVLVLAVFLNRRLGFMSQLSTSWRQGR